MYRTVIGCHCVIVGLLLSAIFITAPNKTLGEDSVAAPTEKQRAVVDESKSWATLGRLYVVIATDDLLEGVPGQIARKNGEIVEAMFKTHVAPGAFAVVKIPTTQMTRQAIFATISNLPLKPLDAVCLYVSAKGGMDRKHGMFFVLGQGKEELYRMELRAALAKKGCRLNVLVSDTCDGKMIPVKPEPKPEPKPETNSGEKTETASETKSGEPVAAGAPETEKAAEKIGLTAPLFFSLFFQSTGSVDILSALPSQLSLPSDQGSGCFVETWSALMDANKNKFLSWYRFFPYLSRGTAILFEKIYVDGAVAPGGMKQSLQTPVMLTLGQDDYNLETFEAVYPRGRDFDTPIPGIADSEIPLSDEGRGTVTKLVQELFASVRPQNDQDKGTHENIDALDPDNTVNGADGIPFSTTIASLIPPRKADKVEKTETDETARSAASSTPPQSSSKPRFGVQAADNKGDGVRITRVFEGFPGYRSGLEVNDVILTIDGKKITGEKDFSDAIDACGDEMKIEVRNAKGGNATTVKVRMRTVQ